MTSTAVYCQFTHLAIACDLTGRQMQLWLRLYELLRHRQDVQLNTSMLLSMLDTSRSQFQRARQALIDQGFLAIRQNRQQQTSYTLLLDGREIASVSMDETAARKPLPDTAEVRQQHCHSQRIPLHGTGMGRKRHKTDHNGLICRKNRYISPRRHQMLPPLAI